MLGLLDGAVEAVGGSAIELTEVVAEENFEGGIAAAELLPEGIAAAEGAAAAEGTRRDKIRQIEFFLFQALRVQLKQSKQQSRRLILEQTLLATAAAAEAFPPALPTPAAAAVSTLTLESSTLQRTSLRAAVTTSLQTRRQTREETRRDPAAEGAG